MAMIAKTEYAISSLLPQTSGFINRFLENHLNKNACKVKFFPVSVYTKDDYKEQLLSAAQNSLPTILAYNTFNGFSEKDTLALNFLEQEVLHLSEKFQPLNTSYTQSNKDSSDKAYDPEPSGRPSKDEGDLTDSGERSRNQ